MPRNMSFMLTTEQVKARTKFVTRRIGWKRLKRGEILNACRKCMGLGPGGKIEELGQIRVISARQETLRKMEADPEYGAREATLEGFPGMTGAAFVAMFCKAMKCDRSTIVTRIEFEYIQETVNADGSK